MLRVAVKSADGAPCDMFVDQIAQLKDLPRNERATAIFRQCRLEHPHMDPEQLPYMAGTAVLFDEQVPFD